MNILLDESVPHKVRLILPSEHTVATTAYQGWLGLKNGVLLAAAESAGFDVLLTADQSLPWQQNFSNRHIAVIVLSTNRWSRLKVAAQPICDALTAVRPGNIIRVAIASPTSS